MMLNEHKRKELTSHVVLLCIVCDVSVHWLILNGTDSVLADISLHVGLTNMKSMDS